LAKNEVGPLYESLNSDCGRAESLLVFINTLIHELVSTAATVTSYRWVPAVVAHASCDVNPVILRQITADYGN